MVVEVVVISGSVGSSGSDSSGGSRRRRKVFSRSKMSKHWLLYSTFALLSTEVTCNPFAEVDTRDLDLHEVHFEAKRNRYIHTYIHIPKRSVVPVLMQLLLFLLSQRLLSQVLQERVVLQLLGHRGSPARVAFLIFLGIGRIQLKFRRYTLLLEVIE